MPDCCRYYYQKIVLEHNHILTRSPSMTKQMRGHKLKEDAVEDMINVMNKARVTHIKVMNILNECVGGSHNLNMTSRDIQNR